MVSENHTESVEKCNKRLECSGTGIFDCGIEEEKGICICCKGTGKVFIGI